jgi:hypothetical protein
VEVSVRRRLRAVSVVVNPYFRLVAVAVLAALPVMVARADQATTHKTPQAAAVVVAMAAVRVPKILERLVARAVPVDRAVARVARVAHLLAHALVRRVVLEPTASGVMRGQAAAVVVLVV